MSSFQKSLPDIFFFFLNEGKIQLISSFLKKIIVQSREPAGLLEMKISFCVGRAPTNYEE